MMERACYPAVYNTETTLPWRSLECIGVIIALFLLSGSIVPLIDLDGSLDASEMAKLRLLGIPIYLISLGILARHQAQLLIAVRRTLPFVVLLVLPFVSVLWSSSPGLTLQRAVALLLSVSLAYALAILFTPRQMLLVTILLLGSGMLFSLIMAAAWPSRAFTVSDGSMRGIFDNKNALGWNAAVATYACSVMAVDRRSRLRTVSIVFLCASLVCLVASQSMTAMTSAASTVVATIFFVALSRTRDLGRTTLVLICLQLVAFMIVGLSELLVPLLEAMGKDATLTGRVPLWHAVDQAIESRLLFGYGYQAFWADASSAGWRVRAEAGWPAPHAHNGFRDTLLGLGLVGFTFLVWTIARALRQGATLLCEAPKEGWLWLNVLVIMFLVMNLTETIILTQNSILFVLFATAVVMFAIRFPTEAQDLMSGFRLVRRRLVLIVSLIVVLMAAAFAMISGLKPSYHAETRLMIHRPLATTLSAEGTGSNDPLNLTSETQRLLSRSVAERVIHELRLDERPEFNPALREISVVSKIRQALRGLVSSDKPATPVADSLEPIIQAYYKALGIGRDGQSDVIQIGFTAGDPDLAATVPNRLVGIYLEERKDAIRGSLDTAEAWLSQRIGEQQDRTRTARDAADTYQQTMGVVSNDGAQSEQIKSLIDLSNRQTRIEESRADIRDTIAALEAADDPSLAAQNKAIPDSIGVMQRDLRTQKQDLERLLDIYGSDAPAVVDFRAKLARSSTDLRNAVDRYLQSMRDKLAALDGEDSAVRSALAAAYEQRSRSALAQTELLRLQRIADREQAALDKLEEQRRGLAGQAMLPGAELEVLSPAAVPLSPEGRSRLFYLIGALFASVSIAVTAAFVIEMMDRTVRSFDQISAMARIVPAGFIPRLRRKDRRNPSVLFGHTQIGMFDEAIRTVMISLKQANGGKLPGSIVVTSAHSGEGKSLVAGSLAIELAANGTPVLLVDGDIRRGHLDALFRSGLDQGLNEFLSGQARIQDIVHHHPSGIDFIPAGSPRIQRRTHPTDMAEIIEMARAKGQIVIFDSAPVLASADTMHLTALTEKTLMIVQWAKTSRRAAEFCLHQIRSVRNTDIVVAINNVKPKQHAKYSFRDSELFLKASIPRRNFDGSPIFAFLSLRWLRPFLGIQR